MMVRPRAVLFDRDGTIVIDEPYSGDPSKVEPVPRAREMLDRLRAHNIPLGVITNQSGVGRGLITMAEVDSVNRRIDAVLGPFDGWFICPHAPEDDCDCRKPKPKLVYDAARVFGVTPESMVVVGDRDADTGAAVNAGAMWLRVDAQHSLVGAIETILAALDLPGE